MNMKTYENVKKAILNVIKDMNNCHREENVNNFVHGEYYEVFYTINEALKDVDDGVASYIIMREGFRVATKGEVLTVARAILKENGSEACLRAFDLAFDSLTSVSKRAQKLSELMVALVRNHQ